MRRIIFNEDYMLKCLIVTSVTMFITLFTSPKIVAVGMLIWLINVGWIMYLLTRGRVPEMIKYHEENIENAKKNKRYFEFGIRSIALPLCAVGLIFVVLNLIVLFYL